MKTNRMDTILRWLAILLAIINFNQAVTVYKLNKVIERVDKIEAYIDNINK